MKQKEQEVQESQQEDSDGSEEIKGGLDRYSVPGDRNVPSQSQQQDSRKI